MTFKQLIKILQYTNLHRWYVMQECWKRGLYWRGLVHDLDKYKPFMIKAYGEFFYEPDGTKRQKRDKTGYYKPEDTGSEAFDYAWFRHTRHSDHHWQYWVVSTSSGEKIYPMSRNAVIEMYCDWVGAGKAQGTLDTKAWYEANKDKLKLSPVTREYIETMVYGTWINYF